MGILHKKKKEPDYEEEPEDQEEDLDMDEDVEDMEEEAPKQKEKFPKYPREIDVKEQYVKNVKKIAEKYEEPKQKESQLTQPQMIVKRLIETGWLSTDKFAQEVINEIAIYREEENRRKQLLEDLANLGVLEEE